MSQPVDEELEKHLLQKKIDDLKLRKSSNTKQQAALKKDIEKLQETILILQNLYAQVDLDDKAISMHASGQNQFMNSQIDGSMMISGVDFQVPHDPYKDQAHFGTMGPNSRNAGAFVTPNQEDQNQRKMTQMNDRSISPAGSQIDFGASSPAKTTSKNDNVMQQAKKITMEKVDSFAPIEVKEEVAKKGSTKPVKEETKVAPPAQNDSFANNPDKSFATEMVNTSLNITASKENAIAEKPKESKSKTDRNMANAKEEEQKRTIQTNQKSKVDKAVHEAYSVGPAGSIQSKKGSGQNVTINTNSTIEAQNDLPISKDKTQLNKQGATDPTTISSEPKGSPMPIKDPTIQRQKPAPTQIQTGKKLATDVKARIDNQAAQQQQPAATVKKEEKKIKNDTPFATANAAQKQSSESSSGSSSSGDEYTDPTEEEVDDQRPSNLDTSPIVPASNMKEVVQNKLNQGIKQSMMQKMGIKK